MALRAAFPARNDLDAFGGAMGSSVSVRWETLARRNGIGGGHAFGRSLPHLDVSGDWDDLRRFGLRLGWGFGDTASDQGEDEYREDLSHGEKAKTPMGRESIETFPDTETPLSIPGAGNGYRHGREY